jgi:hypothetical protein
VPLHPRAAGRRHHDARDLQIERIAIAEHHPVVADPVHRGNGTNDRLGALFARTSASPYFACNEVKIDTALEGLQAICPAPVATGRALTST